MKFRKFIFNYDLILISILIFNICSLIPGASVNNDYNSVSTFDEKEVQTDKEDQVEIDSQSEDANTTVLSGNTLPGLTFLFQYLIFRNIFSSAQLTLTL